MVLRYVTGTTLATAVDTDAYNLLNGDSLILAPGAVLGATGSASDGLSVQAGATVASVQIEGLVFGATDGIDLANVSLQSSLTVTATGRVVGDLSNGVVLSGGFATLTNLGLIQSFQGFAGVYTDSDNVVMTNAGSIIGNAATGNGIYSLAVYSTTLVNTGLISGGNSVTLGIGNDVVWNQGTLVGTVALGGGNDLFQGPGRTEGSINGGLGNDTVVGGAFDDSIYDGYGVNWLIGGDGADLIRVGNLGGDVYSRVFGGVAGGADTSANDTIGIFNNGGSGVNIFLTQGYVSTVSNVLLALITGIENATGSFNDDAIFGSAAANVLNGSFGNDWLVGAGGADTFRFSAASDATGDQVRDFRRSESDRIDLSVIDANAGTLGEDAFVFRTVRTANAAGEAVVINYGTSAVVNLYTNADNIIDGTFVVVYGEAGVTSLTAADFFL